MTKQPYARLLDECTSAQVDWIRRFREVHDEEVTDLDIELAKRDGQFEAELRTFLSYLADELGEERLARAVGNIDWLADVDCDEDRIEGLFLEVSCNVSKTPEDVRREEEFMSAFAAAHILAPVANIDEDEGGDSDDE